MRNLSFRLLSAVIVLLASTMFANGSLFAQDWNGRRYITENSELCHQVIMEELAKDKDFRDGAAAEKDALITILAMTDIRIGIAFKSKNRFLFSVMMNINNQLANKAGLGREEIEQANNQLMQLSADLKESGLYSIKDSKLIIKSKEGSDKNDVEFVILDNGQKLKASDAFYTLVFKRVK